MFGRLNNGWTHVAIYGLTKKILKIYLKFFSFVYPMLVLVMIAPLSAVWVFNLKKQRYAVGSSYKINPTTDIYLKFKIFFKIWWGLPKAVEW